MTEPIRVVHVNDIAFVGSTLVRHLGAHGVAATLVEPARPGASIPYPWKVTTLPLRAAGLLATGLRVRRSRPDLAHVHYARLGIVGPLAGVPYVLHCHGSDIRGVRPGSAWGRFIAPYLRQARLVYYSTPDLEPWVRAFRPDAVFLPNPIEVQDLAPGPDTPRRDVLVGVRLDAVKGADKIVAIVDQIVRRRPATTISILAQGGQLGRVRDVAGEQAQTMVPVSHASMPVLLQGHRLAIGQQMVGALGNYELEAMAVGTPVAARFRFRGAYDAPPPVVDDDTPDAIADRIVRLLEDDGARGALANAGRQWIIGHHAAEAVTARVADDYRRLLGA